MARTTSRGAGSVPQTIEVIADAQTPVQVATANSADGAEPAADAATDPAAIDVSDAANVDAAAADASADEAAVVGNGELADASAADAATDPEVHGDGFTGADDDDLEPLDLALSIVPMSHPDGGTCDRYDTDEAGNILVPALEAASMFEHGFVVAEG